MLESLSIEKILKTLTMGGGEYGEIYFEELRTHRISHEDNRLERIIAGSDRGIGLRLIRDFKTYYGWTNSTREKDILEIASTLSAIPGKRGRGTITAISEKIFPPVTRVLISPLGCDIGVKTDIVLNAYKSAKIDKEVVQIKVIYGDASRKIEIANTLGELHKNEQTYILLAVQVVLSANGRLQIGYETAGGSGGIEELEGGKPEEVAMRAVSRAQLMLHAKKAPGGRMPVILSSHAGGTMIHEAVGHGLEADLATGGLSVYKGKVGKQIASPLITVIDDPTIEGKRGSYAIDDEGVPSRRNILVEKGVLKSYMFDRLQAMKNGGQSTGNGRRESYRMRPIPRMSNTIIAPGETDPEEIISSVQRGLFVKKMGGGQVNTVTGDFVFEVSEGYLLEQGNVGEAVRGATLTGSGPEVLNMIDMVGKDLGYGIGTCGKDGQGVPVADAQPTLRIGEPFIIVGGDATG